MEEKKEGDKYDKGTPATPPAAKVLPKAKGKNKPREQKRSKGSRTSSSQHARHESNEKEKASVNRKKRMYWNCLNGLVL